MWFTIFHFQFKERIGNQNNACNNSYLNVVKGEGNKQEDDAHDLHSWTTQKIPPLPPNLILTPVLTLMHLCECEQLFVCALKNCEGALLTTCTMLLS